MVRRYVCPRLRPRQGAMLVEVAMATVLIGIAFVAVMQFMASATTANSQSVDATTGLNLARAGREWAGTQTYANLAAVSTTGAPAHPLIDGQGNAMSGYSGWTQEFSSTYVNPVDLANDSATDTNLLRVTIKVKKNGNQICSQSWLVSNWVAVKQLAGDS